jgi:hypothetical protein
MIGPPVPGCSVSIALDRRRPPGRLDIRSPPCSRCSSATTCRRHIAEPCRPAGLKARRVADHRRPMLAYHRKNAWVWA